MNQRIALHALAAVLAAACAEAPTQGGPDAGPPDSGPTTPPPPPPTWDGARLERRWLREGFGEGNVLRATDLDGDGSDELILGARGVAAIDRDARANHHPKWSVDWTLGPTVDRGNENDWVYAMELTDATADGVADALVVTSSRDGLLVDGASGAKVWEVPLGAEMLTARAAFLDLDGDGVLDVFPTGGRAAFSGKTGAKLWTSRVPTYTAFAVPAELDGQPGAELFVSTERDELIGTPEAPADEEEADVPLLFALSRAGATLYEATVPGNIISLAAADLTGDGIDEAVVGTSKGDVYAIGATGELWHVALGDGLVLAVAATDVDGDGRAEVFAGHHQYSTDPDQHAISTFVAFTATGEISWRETIGPQVTAIEIVQLDADAAPELLVGAGDVGRMSMGYALALEPAAERHLKWRVQLGEPVQSFTLATVDGKRVVVFGGADCILRAVDPLTGQAAWRWFAGGFVFTTDTGDVDGDGLDEVANGDDHGSIALSDPADGRERWARRLDVGEAGMVNRVTFGDVDGDGDAEVVAAGTRFYTERGKIGVVEVVDGDGAGLASRILQGAGEDVLVADLTGGGFKTIVVGERSHDGCWVHAMDRDALTLWRTRVNTGCLQIRLSAADTDGDGTLEIAYGDTTFSDPPRLVLLEADGAIRWGDTFRVDSYWVAAVPGGVVHGGATTTMDGHVTFRDAVTHETRWSVLLPALTDGYYANTDKVGAAGLFGAAIPDLGGDGVGEILASSAAGEVRLLNGATGEVAWTMEAADLAVPLKERHGAATLTYVPHGAKGPAWIAAAQWSSNRLRSRVFALRPLDGAILGDGALMGEAHAIGVGRFTRGEYGAAVAAGLGVYTFEARKD